MRGAEALLAGLLAVGTASAADTHGSLTADGVERTWQLHVPKASGPMPLLLAFHGASAQGTGMERLTGLDAVADERGIIVAYPDGLGRHWNDGRKPGYEARTDLQFVAALLDTLEAQYHIDPNAIFATGISNGAMLAQWLACAMSGRIAAVASVSGYLPSDDLPDCATAKPVAVMVIAGTADPLVPYDGGTVDALGRKTSGRLLAAEATADFWRELDGCGPASVPEMLPPIALPDETSIMRVAAEGCRGGTGVVLLTVEDGGHTWPDGPQYLPVAMVGRVSHQLDASRAIVEFCLAHRRG